eukprot:gnl/MRDRNA2_/MRDRNA2_110524_c0_seq1.p1 gnl/MRDRNA2_/MRDRNA2_110524_c0~~gnl/MRDRNA2_/MRDRNA2_110524_c0_seq1.p1  ORF type:complete len:147 (+),score=23.91 gnl/MRDRNA2_/MRDRNA2_110524_c0_seq1:291-731(+)
MAVSKDEMMSSYIFTFAILLTVMTNVCQYFWVRRPKAEGCWERNGAFILMVLSTFFILLSPFKNLVVNLCMESFRQNGFDSTIEFWLDMMYMPWLGTKPLQMYTAVAYVFMFWSTCKQVNMLGKFQSLTMQYSKKSSKDDNCSGGS